MGKKRWRYDDMTRQELIERIIAAIKRADDKILYFILGVLGR